MLKLPDEQLEKALSTLERILNSPESEHIIHTNQAYAEAINEYLKNNINKL